MGYNTKLKSNRKKSIFKWLYKDLTSKRVFSAIVKVTTDWHEIPVAPIPGRVMLQVTRQVTVVVKRHLMSLTGVLAACREKNGVTKVEKMERIAVECK